MEIPKELHSYNAQAPFEHCLVCNKYLLDNDTEYLIEKAVRNHAEYNVEETIFDYAICLDCALDMTNELSSESLQSLQQYFYQNISADRMQKLPEDEKERLSFMMNSCMFKGTPKEKSVEYQMVARCKGTQLQMDTPPYIICAEAMDEMTGLLSDKTLDELDNFKDKFLGGPPELKDLLKGKPVLIV